MFGFTRLTILMVLVVFAGIFAGITAGIAQSPKNDPAPAPASDPDVPALERFRDVLEGKKPARATGDAVFDGLQEVIRQRGSILDGSSLDPANEESEAKDSSESQRAFAAELLLRSSRTLEQIGSVDETRQELVKKMRDEAVRLLSE